jgi:hypothetical protein
VFHQVELAIERTLPTGRRQRHKAIFEFSRELKAIPGLAAAEPIELAPYVRMWHARALRYIATRPFEETLIDFVEGWHKVKFPKGQEPIAVLFKQAIESELPDAAEQFEQQKLKQLVSLCRELQRACGEKPFFLSTRTAGELLGVTHLTAWRWLRLLVHRKILETVTVGSRAENKASEFRYLCDL